MHLMIRRKRFLRSLMSRPQINKNDIVIMQLGLGLLEGYAVRHTVNGIFHDIGSHDQIIHCRGKGRCISQVDIGKLFSRYAKAHGSSHRIDTFV